MKFLDEIKRSSAILPFLLAQFSPLEETRTFIRCDAKINCDAKRYFQRRDYSRSTDVHPLSYPFSGYIRHNYTSLSRMKIRITLATSLSRRESDQYTDI